MVIFIAPDLSFVCQKAAVAEAVVWEQAKRLSGQFAAD